MSGPPLADPPRGVVVRIVAEEAARARTTPFAVTGHSRKLNDLLARRRAVKRIAAETGCSALGIARVWGMSEGSAKKWLGKDMPNPTALSVYDQSTRTRLTWAHGENRARDIFAGRDAATNADLAAWSRVIGRPA